MTATLQRAKKRFLKNIKNPVVRRNVAIMAAGKIIGLTIVLLIAGIFMGQPAFAQSGNPPADLPTINAVNTVWTLVAAFLVFCMQVGFVMLEAGFARSREAVNILVEGIADTCI